MEKDVHQFRRDLSELVARDPEVKEFVQDFEASLQTEPPDDQDIVNFSHADPAFGTIFFSLVSYILFRLAKDSLDHKRALNETKVAEQRINMLNDLVNDGWDRDAAESVVSHSLEFIANHAKDDSVLARIISVAAKYLPIPIDKGGVN